jgi:hypothetical protein
MKNLFGLLLLTLLAANVIAQKEKFDIISYKPLKGWTKETKVNSMVLTKIDGGSWCQIILYKNTVSKGDINADFNSEWKTLIIPNCPGISSPDKENPETGKDWTVMSGSGVWKFNGNNVATILTTYSGNGASVSIVCNATAKPYLDAFKNFMAGVDLYNEKKEAISVIAPNQNNTNQNVSSAVKGNYKFNTTNFDDGWTSTIQEDWVEVTKGNKKVLIHFPKEGTIIPADPDKLTNAAWNILVAPRYSNLKNYKTSYVEDSKRPYFGMGYATEIKTGKPVFIVLFRRGGGWIEAVTADNNSFTQEFGFNPESIRWGSISQYMGGWVVNNSQGNTINADQQVFDRLENMVGKNKFAVAASDLYNTGEWKDHYSSNTFYANYYTGAYAGMSTYSSSQWFVFKAGNNYHWELAAANSYGGQIATAKATGNGTYKSLNDWKLFFSEMEGKAKTFDVYFSAIKGGRVLWMNDAQTPGSGIFTGFKSK